jgi:hypothetical protein
MDSNRVLAATAAELRWRESTRDAYREGAVMSDQPECLVSECSRCGVGPTERFSINGHVTMHGDRDAVDAFRREAIILIQDIAAAHGQRALENPRSSAIVHEAGHAVMYAHFGEPVRYVKIRRCKRGPGAGQWLGVTMGGGKWRSDADTTPKSDFRQACYHMAGVVAEVLFDTDNFRQGSSLDEILVAQRLAANIAAKTRGNPVDVRGQVLRMTSKILKDNALIVHEIATLLDRHNVVRKNRLAPILERVTHSPAESEGDA